MNSVAASPLPGTLVDPRYPDEDGRFMGDTDFHSIAMIWLREGLEDQFAEQPVYVASNLIYYFKEGDRKSRKDPDVLVAKGVGKHRRRSYRIWEEGVIPSTLFEIASRRTWRIDLGEKRHLYAQLNIKEYFVFDPESRYLDPPLQGFRTRHGKSVPMKPAAAGSLVSKELGLRLVPEGAMLRLIDLRTSQPVLTRSERAEQASERAEQEQKRAQQERERAEQERKNAQQERERAQELLAENERLRALLKKNGHKP